MKNIKKIKNIKKYVITLSTIIVTLMMNFLGLANSVYAAELGTSAKLEKIGDCGSLLKYNGTTVVTTYVAYRDGNDLYPAYCLNVNLPGVGESGSYNVSTKDYITDVGLWRVIINGYPYKTLSQLGCNTKEEAFTATKHAVYCYIHGINASNYSAIGEAGKRTLKAMKKIISNANKSTETKMETTIKILKDNYQWKIDDIDKNYISKIYEVESNADYKNYTISIEKDGKANTPDGWKLTDENNKEKSTFKKGEKYKLLIPIKSLSSKVQFKMYVKAEMNTKPILYGKAPNKNLQDYAITTLKYESGEGSIKDTCKENITKISVLKQEKETQKPLKNVIFDLLDENKQPVYTGLKTDKNGKVTIKAISPGKYYLREIETLNGYVKYDKDIELNVDLNEDFKVTVNNSKEKRVEVEKLQEEVVVGKLASYTSIKEGTASTNIENTESNENVERSNVENTEKNNTENTSITENIEKNNKENTNMAENKEKNNTENTSITENIKNNSIENNEKEKDEKIQKVVNVEQNETIKKLPVTGM